MPSITYAAQPFDLALLSDLQDTLGNASSTSASLLQRLLSSASQFILSRINRTIFNSTYTNELYDGSGFDELVLNNYPINSISNLQANNAAGIGLFTQTLGLQPQVIPASSGVIPGYVFDATTISLVSGYIFPVGRKNISVSYTAGYGPVSTPVYVAGTTYAAGVSVVGPDFNVYVSLQAGNTGHTPSSSAAWWAFQCPMLPMDLSQAAIELANLKYKRASHMDQDGGSLANQNVSWMKKDVPEEVATIIKNYNRRFQL